MKIDSTGDAYPAPLRDELASIREQGFKQYRSYWTRIEGGATGQFLHTLKEVPRTVDVLEASGSQGQDQTQAASVTVTKTDRLVSVVNGGSSRFFMVRAF